MGQIGAADGAASFPTRNKHVSNGGTTRSFAPEERQGRLKLLISPDGRDDSLSIHQDASIYGAALEEGGSVTYELDDARHAWVQVVRGEVTLNGVELSEGDGAAVSEEDTLEVQARGDAEVLLFDLA